MKRPRTRTTQLLVLAAAVLLAACVGWLVYRAMPYVMAGRAIRQEIEKIRKRGEPVTPADLISEKIPESQNAAVVYARAFAMAKPSRRIDLRKLRDFVNLSPEKRTENDWQQAAQLAARYRHLIPVIDEAQARPECRFPVDWSQGWDADTSHLARLREVASLLQVSALLAARAGHSHDSTRFVVRSLRLAESLSVEPTFVSQFVRRSILLGAVEVLRDADPTDLAEVESLLRELVRIDLLPGFKTALLGERVMGMLTFDMLRSGHYGPKRATRLPPGSTQPLGVMWNADELFFLRSMANCIAVSPQSYRVARHKLHYLDLESSYPRYAMVSAVLLPTAGTFAGRDTGTAAISGTLIRLLLLIYRERFGAYPRTLDDLEKKLGRRLPEDVFSGKAFVYKPQRRNFLLYSIGEDLDDDGGRPVAEKGIFPRNGDIVWKVDR